MVHSNRDDPGILLNVFSFVSREIGEFMINATGKSEVRSVFSDFKRIKLKIDHRYSPVHPNGDRDVMQNIRSGAGNEKAMMGG